MRCWFASLISRQRNGILEEEEECLIGHYSLGNCFKVKLKANIKFMLVVLTDWPSDLRC